MTAAGAGAAGAAPAGAKAPIPQTSPWAFLLQLAAMAFLYNLYMAPKAAPPPLPHAPLSDPASGALLAAAAATASPAAPPLAAGLADSLGLGAAFKATQDAINGVRSVAPELQHLEDARRGNLALARSLGTQVAPLWPPFTPFEVLVYLSLSAAPLDDCTESIRGEAPGGSSGGGGGGAAAPLPNATFADLLLEELKGSGARHAPPLLWRQRHLTLEDTSRSTREQHFNVSLPPSVLANASSVYAHVFFRQVGAPLLPSAPGYSSTRVHKTIVPLVKLLARKPRKPTFSLMEGKDATPTPLPRFGIGAPADALKKEAAEGEEGGGSSSSSSSSSSSEEVEVASGSGSELALDGAAAAPSSALLPPAPAAPLLSLPYWKPTLHLQLVHDWSVFPSASSLPPNVAPVIQLEPIPQHLGGASSGAGFGYLPHLYVNDFWLLGHHLVALNASLAAAPHVPLALSYSPGTMWRWALQSQMQSQWDVQASMGLAANSDTDMIKSILTDTNPWLLALTMVVSLLHSVFDFLAFRNDISFWRSAKSMEGLSMRTVAMSVFFQGVIMLYLFDFGDTSWMVLGSTVVGFGIECWKLMRALGGKVSWAGWRPTGVDFGGSEASTVSYALSRTAEYDSIATGHLLVVMYPLVAGYAGYSLAYERHRGWYSWVLSSLTSFIYMFGFAQMVPQLYINYRLKSVAAMPWKTMAYKSLNTFIDDLFSFIVKMPMMCVVGGGGVGGGAVCVSRARAKPPPPLLSSHARSLTPHAPPPPLTYRHRLACFRDDIIFFIYLYQRWVYRVDVTRRNEYGQLVGDEEEKQRIARGESRDSRRGKYELRE